MTTIAMPDPVASLKARLAGAVVYPCISAENLPSGKHDLITTWQAEAYANAMVREALKEAAQACEARIGTGDAGVDTIDCDVEAQECAAAIRALIPKEPPCDT